MKKMLLVAALAVTMVFSLAACGSSSSSSDAASAEVTTNKDAKSISFVATVNEKGLKADSTMHYIVNADGKAAKKAIFTTNVTPEQVYNALEEVGGKPWNTSTDRIEDGEFTDGPKVKVTLSWDGEDSVAFADTVKTADGNIKDDMRFSGNLDNNNDCGSGCVMCLNSCWAGILSNAAYGFNAIDGGDVVAQANTDNLPEAGTEVTITFTLK